MKLLFTSLHIIIAYILMNRSIIVKGVAGLGDRLSTLGRSLLLADLYSAKVYPDWRDTLWQEGFFRYFKLSDSCCLKSMPDEFGIIAPQLWTPDKIRHTDGKDSVGGVPGVIESGILAFQQAHTAWDTLVILAYSGYKKEALDRLMTSLSFTEEVVKAAMFRLKHNNLTPFCYKVVSFRNIDKQGMPEDDIMKLLHPSDVLLGDDSDFIAKAVRNRQVIAPTVLPPRLIANDIHHTVPNGWAKHELNMSACIDMLIGGLAREYVITCPSSIFSGFVKHGRDTGWFKKQLGF